MPSDQATFHFLPKAIITLPANFRTEQSKNCRQFPETPEIMTVWLEKGEAICHFCLDSAYLGKVKQVGIFVPACLKEGDQLRIDWVEGLCACALLLPRIAEEAVG
jgi:hypothetical protein